MMCYKMRRFEKIAEEKKRRQKEKELSFAVEDESEVHSKAALDSGSRRHISSKQKHTDVST